MFVVVALIGLMILMGPTYWSMISVWFNSDTFAHGFLVIPISLLLVCMRRKRLTGVPMGTDWQALAVLFALGAIWWLGHRVDLLALQQLAATAMIPAMCWLLLGTAVTRVLIFPLAFLIFAVPIGTELIPPMMSFTAAFTVRALQWVEVPVYAQDMTIVLPNAVFEVIEACSGVRYLIVSICLATLFAHLMYRSPWRGVALVMLAVVLSVVGNGLRAFGIVMIAHLTNGRVAVDVDHILYGWVFFGIIMFTLVWLGSLWREPEEESGPDEQPATPAAPAARPSVEDRRRSVLGVLAGLAVVSAWPALASYAISGVAAEAPVRLQSPVGRGGWQSVVRTFTEWKPWYLRPSAEQLKVFGRRDERVGLYVAYFHERVPHAKRLVPRTLQRKSIYRRWSVRDKGRVAVTLDGETVSIFETRLDSDDADGLLVWHLNWVSNQAATDLLEVRVREIALKLVSGAGGGAVVAVLTPVGGSAEHARAVLRDFLAEMWPEIETSLRAVESRR